MKRKKIIIGTLIAALLIGAATVVAVVSPDAEVMRLIKNSLTPAQFSVLMDFRAAHQKDMEDRLAQRDDPAKIWRDLALTENQQDKLLDALAMNVDEVSTEVQKVQTTGGALRRAVFAGVPDSPELRDASVKLGHDLGDAAVAAARALADARSILTPAQVKLLEDKLAEHDQHLEAAVNKMPSRVEELVDLWKILALTPGQVEALSTIHDRMPVLMRERHKKDREEFRSEMKDILTPAQLALADRFRAEGHDGRHERMREERKKFEAELGLSGSQKIQLVNLAIGRREALESAATLLIAATQDLRDKVLAVPTDEAAIRQSADRLAEIIGYSASMAAELVTDSRKILSDRQFILIEKQLDRHDAMIARRIAEAPARVHRLVSFLDELALTPAQKNSILDLVEKKHEERKDRFMKMHRAR